VRLLIEQSFNITGRGKVYAVKYDEEEIIRMGDIFKDIEGNHFEVCGFDFPRNGRRNMLALTLKGIEIEIPSGNELFKD